MPGFSFARGNAKKLLSLPFYAFGTLASLVTPRANDRWVFGSGSGIGEGALALFLRVRTENPDLRLTWLASDERDIAAATAIGIPAVPGSSARGFWLTLRARVVVVTHGFGDVNRYGTRGAFVVQLWHGVPLKLIQLDSPATLRTSIPLVSRQVRSVLRRAYRRGYAGIRLMPAASELVAERLRTAFGLPPDRIVATGDPRDDVLSRGAAAERSAAARKVLFDKLALPNSTSRVLLYAPTWRDGAPDPGSPTPRQWQRIDEYLESTDAVLVVRPHPHGIGDYHRGVLASGRVHILDSQSQSDVTPVLAAVDLLITDFSSIAYDYSLTGGPILFLAPDEESYSRTRGLYEPYREFSGGREVRSWEALLHQLVRYDSDDDWAAEVRAHSDALCARHFAFRDGRNTERVYAEILRRLKAHQ